MRRIPSAWRCCRAGCWRRWSARRARAPGRREEADRARQRRRGRHRRRARHPGGDRHAAARRQRRRRRGRRGRRARRHRAVLVRHRRRRLHGHPHAARQGHHDRRPRDGAGRDAARLVPRERRAARVRRRALQRALGRRARHRRAPGSEALRPLRHDVARAGAAAGHRRRPPTASRSTRRSSTRRRRNVDYFDDVPSTAAIYLDPDGTPRDVGTHAHATPTWPRPTSCIGRNGAERASTAAPSPRAMAEAAADPPIADDADHAWRPGLMTERDLARLRRASERKPTRVGYRGLDVYGMGPPSSGGSTVGEALNILEGYRRSARDRTRSLHRFLEASRYAFADRNAYLADPDFFDVPLRGLLSDSFAAERRALITETAATSPVARRATRTTTRRRPRRRRATISTGASRRRTSRSPTTAATSSPTRSRSSRPAATASSCRARGSCSTTS